MWTASGANYETSQGRIPPPGLSFDLALMKTVRPFWLFQHVNFRSRNSIRLFLLYGIELIEEI